MNSSARVLREYSERLRDLSAADEIAQFPRITRRGRGIPRVAAAWPAYLALRVCVTRAIEI